jgi:hypothetical protein
VAAGDSDGIGEESPSRESVQHLYVLCLQASLRRLLNVQDRQISPAVKLHSLRDSAAIRQARQVDVRDSTLRRGTGGGRGGGWVGWTSFWGRLGQQQRNNSGLVAQQLTDPSGQARSAGETGSVNEGGELGTPVRAAPRRGERQERTPARASACAAEGCAAPRRSVPRPAVPGAPDCAG